MAKPLLLAKPYLNNVVNKKGRYVYYLLLLFNIFSIQRFYVKHDTVRINDMKSRLNY